MFNFEFNESILQKCLPKVNNINDWYDSILEALPQYNINTIERVTAFIAQCSHESGEFTILSENLNYSAEGLRRVFGKYFTTLEQAQAYARKPEKIANRVYQNRMGNGSEQSGDGWKYRGRGLIQLTGKQNYKECSEFLFNDDTLLKTPDVLTQPYYAIHSACWFWNKRNLNRQADIQDLKEMTRLINGGYNGLEDRICKYNKILEIIQP